MSCYFWCSTFLAASLIAVPRYQVKCVCLTLVFPSCFPFLACIPPTALSRYRFVGRGYRDGMLLLLPGGQKLKDHGVFQEPDSAGKFLFT